MPFFMGGVNLDDFYFTDADIVDQYVNGTLFMWGYNSYGQIGDNTNDYNKYTPVKIGAGGIISFKISCGRNHSAAVKTDGTLWAWGQNYYGQLGDDTTDDRSSPVQTITGGYNWKQVACGYAQTAAIKSDGTLWNWGVYTYTPEETVAGGTDWKQVSCGGHIAGVKTDGTLWLWGSNSSGQLGDGTTDDNASPIETITGGNSWTQVSCGGAHSAAIKTDGTLWLWGSNYSGQLGDGTGFGQNKSSPVQTIAGGNNWKQVSCGGRSTAAIKTDGTLWAWGKNPGFGDEAAVGGEVVESPVQTIAGGNNWKQVECGYGHTAAVQIDG
jgi:alpha-tubulin suppressor-like RCC1 family protein